MEVVVLGRRRFGGLVVVGLRFVIVVVWVCVLGGCHGIRWRGFGFAGVGCGGFGLPAWVSWVWVGRRGCGYIYMENVAGKVALITGASSGIGEHVAYEYARRGACLVLVARREDCLQKVADKARELRSPEVIVVRADVSKVEECKRFVEEALNHFGRLDHLVNNAGMARLRLFEEVKQFSDMASVMFAWTPAESTEGCAKAIVDSACSGDMYLTEPSWMKHVAYEYARKRSSFSPYCKTRGPFRVVADRARELGSPEVIVASKAALLSFFETLRTEFGPDIGITIVTPGLIDSEMTTMENRIKAQGTWLPSETTEGCAKAIVASACRGDMYLTEPSWVNVLFWIKMLCPEALESCFHSILVKRPRTSKDS
uniref:Uncharacterized protein n=1 Tax=Fagus sylvatica TaxID=28930 RepID=A0A2N9J1X4_FAGSY